MVTKKSVKSQPKVKTIQVAGKRKRAVARATLKIGKGIVRINSTILDLYEPELAKMKIKEPLLIAGKSAEAIDIKVNVSGGGWASQAEATRLAIAKGLVAFTESAELKQKFLDYDRHLLVADTRYKETRKPGTHSRARSKRQKSYR